MISLSEQKKRLRESAAKRREGYAAGRDIGSLLREKFAEVGGIDGFRTVSGYWPIGAEANVMPLLLDRGSRGLTMALPVVPERGRPLTFRIWREADSMAVGPFGIREPKSESPQVEPDLLPVPRLAFDRSGKRLGYGAGFYDRTLAALRSRKKVMAVGIAYAAQECETVPCGKHDEPLDRIITENETITSLMKMP